MELSNSIKNQGLLVPIIVKEVKGKNKVFSIVAGERRWRASKLAGLDFIDVIISNKSEKSSSLSSIIENVQREELKSLEEAEAYNNLINEHKLTHDDISKFTGKSRSYISNSVRIMGLPEEIKKLLSDKVISFGHARALLASKNISKLAKEVVKNQMNVRQTEELVKEEQKEKIGAKSKKNLAVKDSNIMDYEKYLSLKIGYEVNIKDRSGKGVLSVKYKSLDQLEEIIAIFNEKND